MQNKIILVFFLCFIGIGFSKVKNHWKKQTQSTSKTTTQTNLSVYDSYDLDEINFIEDLQQEGITQIKIPVSKNVYETFEIKKTSNFSESLAEKFPYILSFKGKSVTSSKIIRISSSSSGIFVVITDINGKMTFVSESNSDTSAELSSSSNYLSYEKEAIKVKKNKECNTSSDIIPDTYKTEAQISSAIILNSNQAVLKSYDLAMACTPYFGRSILASFYGDSTIDAVTNILIKYNEMLTVINNIFERDVGIKMELVSNIEDIIFYDTTSDSGFPDDLIQWENDEMQQAHDNITSIIGAESYEIGHNLNVSTSGGNAWTIGNACDDSRKGGAFSSVLGFLEIRDNLVILNSLTNELLTNYTISYVMHELGHQLGAYHIHNSQNCPATGYFSEVEPGSGSTIMGYAGLCGDIANIQEDSDDYFNSVSITNINDYLSSIRSSCGTDISTTASLLGTPIDVNNTKTYTIPPNTPFKLEVDPIENVDSYTWEQADPERTQLNYPSSTQTEGPIFRSLPPSSNPYRYFPKYDSVITGKKEAFFEVLPSVERTLNFNITARGEVEEVPQTSINSIKVNVDGDLNPINITSDAIWYNNNLAQINWNKINDDIIYEICLINAEDLNSDPLCLETSPDDGGQFVNVDDLIPEGEYKILLRSTNHIVYDVSSSTIQKTNTAKELAKDPIISDIVSPNGDGQNDALYIEDVGQYPHNKLQVFNTNFELLFTINDYDGITSDKFVSLEEGSYYYYYETNDNLNNVISKSGWFYLRK